MKKQLFVVLGFLLFTVNFAQAQYTQIGNGGFQNSTFGPISTDTVAPYYSRHAYTYPSGSLGNLTHGDSITGLAFRSQVFDSLVGNCSFKIYIGTSARADFGTGSLNWVTKADSMTLVYSGNPKTLIGNTPGYVDFLFNQTNKYGFDTTGGAVNFQVLVEFTQQSAQVGQTFWYCESGFYVPAFVSFNETKYQRGTYTSSIDSFCNLSSSIKPTLRIYHPEYETELEVKKIYSLGSIPTLMNRADTIKAVIANLGSDTVVDHKVYLNVTGSNSHSDSLLVTIPPYQEKMVFFFNHQPTTTGAETIKISVATDSVLTNNELTKDRLIKYNEYSHVDPFIGNSGGIGFNGSTGDFVAKFYVNGTSYMNQIKVDFSSIGRAFQIGVWEDNGPDGTPGNLVFISDTGFSTAGTYILPMLPRVPVEGGFYVGIRQASNTNVGFSYQVESPIRPHTFYFAAPASDTNWVGFSPGFDFNFNIQPRLQVANDVAAVSVTAPMDDDTLRYSPSDSLLLKAMFVNFGFQDQPLFNVKMEVLNRFGSVVLTSDKQITLDSGDSLEVEFDKFSLFNLGEFTARATAQLNIDSVSENNVSESVFHLVKDHDVAVDIIYSPNPNDSFEVNEEYFWPTVRVINYGVQPQTNIPVTGQLIKDGAVVLSQTVFLDLDPSVSLILNFDSLALPTFGNFCYRAFTGLAIDSFPENDTTTVCVVGKKSHDMQVTEIRRPDFDEKFIVNSQFKPFFTIRNDGLENEDSIWTYASIYDYRDSLVYSDTSITNLGFFSNNQVIFKDFDCNELGNYTCVCEVFIETDQDTTNDIMMHPFRVVENKDLAFIDILPLEHNIVYPLSSAANTLQVILRNNGFENATNAPISINIENNSLQTIFSDTILVDLIADQIDTFDFSPELALDAIGDYYLTAKNLWSEEVTLSNNDSILLNYKVRQQLDVLISEHVTPKDLDTLELFIPINPKVIVTNVGIDTAVNLEVVVVFKRENGHEVVRDTLRIAELGSSEAIDKQSDMFWPSDSVGAYTMESEILNSDNDASNNKQVTTFYVVKTLDVMSVESVYPPSNDSLPVDRLYQPIALVKNDGLEDAESVTVQYLVEIGNVEIYNESVIVQINSGEEKQVVFDSTLTYTDPALATVTISVATSGDVFLFNDAVGSGFTFYDNASVSETINSGLMVYPNPFNNNIAISSSSKIASIKVYDTQGKLVFANQPNSQKASIALDVNQGSYVIEVETSKGIERKRLVKTR